MTVKELKELLSQYDDDMEVGVEYDSFWANPKRVVQYDENSVIIKFT